jgi:hypothetical protein
MKEKDQNSFINLYSKKKKHFTENKMFNIYAIYHFLVYFWKRKQFYIFVHGVPYVGSLKSYIE